MSVPSMEAEAVADAPLELEVLEVLAEAVLSTGEEFKVSAVVGEARWTEYEAPAAMAEIRQAMDPPEMEQAAPV